MPGRAGHPLAVDRDDGDRPRVAAHVGGRRTRSAIHRADEGRGALGGLNFWFCAEAGRLVAGADGARRDGGEEDEAAASIAEVMADSP